MPHAATLLSNNLIGKGWGELREYRIRIELKNGRSAIIERECYDRGNAAAVLPFNPTRRTVLLVGQIRVGPLVSGDAPFVLEAAAGALDGDSPETCALREAHEETGCRVFKLEYVMEAYAMPAAVTEKVTLFVAEYVDPPQASAGIEAEGEFIEVVELPLQDALAMVSSGEIIDMKTIILIQHLALRERVPAL